MATPPTPTPPTSTTTTSINSPTTTSTGPDTTDAIFPTNSIEEVRYNPGSKDKAIMDNLMNLIIGKKLPFIRLATPNAKLEVRQEKKGGKNNKWRIRQVSGPGLVAGPHGAIVLCLDAGGKRNDDFDNQSVPIILRVKEIYLKASDNELQKYLFSEFKQIRGKKIREKNMNSVIGGAIDFGDDDDGEMTLVEQLSLVEQLPLVEQISFYAEHMNSLLGKADQNQLNELARTKTVNELAEKMKTLGGGKKTDTYQLRF
jgi:hypothetical protein